MEMLNRFKSWVNKPRIKKRMYLAGVLIVACVVVYRFSVIGAQNRLSVYNPARAALIDGVPVETITVNRHDDVLNEPITIKNNRAYVSGARARLLRAGQKIGDGVIVSVATGIDLDTGMHAVRTRGVSDGLQYAQISVNGYFVPSYAVNRNVVYVVENSVAVPRNVNVAATDADTAYITAGLNDGDVVVLSKVSDGAKVNTIK